MTEPHLIGDGWHWLTSHLHSLGAQPRLWLSAASLTFVTYRWLQVIPAGGAGRSIRRLFNRLWHGDWLYQEHTGEFHMIKGRGKHGAVIDVTGWSRRYATEVIIARERRKRMLGLSLFALACIGLLANYIYGGGSIVAAIFGHGTGFYVASFFAVTFCGLGLVTSFFSLIGSGFSEALYQSNFQHMEGARTIDPRPAPPAGREAVQQQKGHGDAGPAQPGAISQVLGSTRRGEPNLRFKD